MLRGVRPMQMVEECGNIIITKHYVGLLAGWLLKIGENFSPIGLPTFGG